MRSLKAKHEPKFKIQPGTSKVIMKEIGQVRFEPRDPQNEKRAEMRSAHVGLFIQLRLNAFPIMLYRGQLRHLVATPDYISLRTCRGLLAERTPSDPILNSSGRLFRTGRGGGERYQI